MKLNLITLAVLLLISISGFSQVRVPKNFYFVKGLSNAGRDDYYTDGQFRLFEDTPFQAEHPTTDYGVLNQLHSRYKIDFNKVRKDYYTGIGYSDHTYKTIVVLKGYAFILTSPINNPGYQNYSKWLISQMRFHFVEGDQLYFRK